VERVVPAGANPRWAVVAIVSKEWKIIPAYYPFG
jgi:hypothetical protein